MKVFTVYSKNGCPYCTKVVSALQLAELQYVELKLGRDFDKNQFYADFGQGNFMLTLDKVLPSLRYQLMVKLLVDAWKLLNI
ncbi:glutaredoxin [Synechococcus phage S-B05]|nr:glutaredoxin [Synechococcus phage S-B05]